MSGKSRGARQEPPAVTPSVHCLGQNRASLPGHLDWLGPREALVHDALRTEKRRRDWLLGRWSVKLAVAALRQRRRLPRLDPSAIEIQAAADGAPQLLVGGKTEPWTLSLSHSSNQAFCAVVPATVLMGCDIERIEPRSHAFVTDYFTSSERETIGAVGSKDHPLLANLIWSAKESALKALRCGLRADTRSVEVRLKDLGRPSGEWLPLQVVETASGRVFAAWWKISGEFVQTLAWEGNGPPIELSPR